MIWGVSLEGIVRDFNVDTLVEWLTWEGIRWRCFEDRDAALVWAETCLVQRLNAIRNSMSLQRRWVFFDTPELVEVVSWDATHRRVRRGNGEVKVCSAEVVHLTIEACVRAKRASLHQILDSMSDKMIRIRQQLEGLSDESV